MLDERSLRKPSFSAGYPVVLADGQAWTFPKPRIRFRPRIGSDGRVEVGGGAGFGPEFDASIDVLYGVVETDGIEQLRVTLEMAVRLLRSNYDLTNDDVATLIVYEPNDPEAMERWGELERVLIGISPKPLPAT
jgi:hypothetical protein